MSALVYCFADLYILVAIRRTDNKSKIKWNRYRFDKTYSSSRIDWKTFYRRENTMFVLKISSSFHSKCAL